MSLQRHIGPDHGSPATAYDTAKETNSDSSRLPTDSGGNEPQSPGEYASLQHKESFQSANEYLSIDSTVPRREAGDQGQYQQPTVTCRSDMSVYTSLIDQSSGRNRSEKSKIQQEADSR